MEKGAVEKFFEPEKIKTKLPWRIFNFSLVLFALTLFTYFGLFLGYRPYLSSELRQVESKLDAIGGEITVQERENLLRFYSQLSNLEILLERHIKGSNFFSFLEKNTLPGVYFEAAKLSLEENNLELQGAASSYLVLAEQILVFEQADGIRRIILKESRKGDVGIDFLLHLLFDKTIFKL